MLRGQPIFAPGLVVAQQNLVGWFVVLIFPQGSIQTLQTRLVLPQPERDGTHFRKHIGVSGGSLYLAGHQVRQAHRIGLDGFVASQDLGGFALLALMLQALVEQVKRAAVQWMLGQRRRNQISPSAGSCC